MIKWKADSMNGRNPFVGVLETAVWHKFYLCLCRFTDSAQNIQTTWSQTGQLQATMRLPLDHIQKKKTFQV